MELFVEAIDEACSKTNPGRFTNLAPRFNPHLNGYGPYRIGGFTSLEGRCDVLGMPEANSHHNPDGRRPRRFCGYCGPQTH
jgi:hypothetical protein